MKDINKGTKTTAKVKLKFYVNLENIFIPFGCIGVKTSER